MKKLQKGFTIVELVVVVAIIAILATIVMVNVTQYIGTARGAAVKSNLQALSTVAAQYIYDGNATFSGMCSSSNYGSKISSAFANMNPSLTLNCYDNVTTSTTDYPNGRWCAYVTSGTTTYCLSYNGSTYEGTGSVSNCSSNTYTCN